MIVAMQVYKLEKNIRNLLKPEGSRFNYSNIPTTSEYNKEFTNEIVATMKPKDHFPLLTSITNWLGDSRKKS
ncbi:hypothetical protein FACS189472_18820 [Alphaproteobacteria bacterium]|nr:hypothetical protein FACS189472_18820 [Alphaproteobacteria bacterium]